VGRLFLLKGDRRCLDDPDAARGELKGQCDWPWKAWRLPGGDGEVEDIEVKAGREKVGSGFAVELELISWWDRR
jgi:hypothetical protein